MGAIAGESTESVIPAKSANVSFPGADAAGAAAGGLETNETLEAAEAGAGVGTAAGGADRNPKAEPPPPVAAGAGASNAPKSAD